jgi:hypothetical protein
MDWPRSSFNSAPEYMVSGIPFVTSSNVSAGNVVRIDFDKVTKSVKVCNTSLAGTDLRVGFSRLGVMGGNYFLVSGSVTQEFDVRTRSMFFYSTAGTVTFSVYAAQTTIDPTNVALFTGSNGLTVG